MHMLTYVTLENWCCAPTCFQLLSFKSKKHLRMSKCSWFHCCIANLYHKNHNKKLSSACEEFKFRGWYDAAFRLGQETHQILFEFQQTRRASRSKSRSRSQDVSSLAFYRRRIPNLAAFRLLAETKRRVIPATKFKFFTSTWQFFIAYNSWTLRLGILLR